MKRIEKRAEFSRRQKSSGALESRGQNRTAAQLCCTRMRCAGGRPVLKSELSPALKDFKHYEHASGGTGDTLRCVFTIGGCRSAGSLCGAAGPGCGRRGRAHLAGTGGGCARRCGRPWGTAALWSRETAAPWSWRGCPERVSCRPCCPGPGRGSRRGLGSHGRPGPARRFPLTSCVMAPPAYRHKEAASGSSADECSPGTPTEPSSLPGCSGTGREQRGRAAPALPHTSCGPERPTGAA